MDKIREEFEKRFPVTPYFEYDGTWYQCDKKTLKEYHDSYSSVTCYNRLLHGFREACNSVSEEIRDLQEQVGYLKGDVINIQGSKKAEIKKLKDAVKEIVRNYKQHLNYDKYPHCTIKWFANRAQYLAKNALNGY